MFSSIHLHQRGFFTLRPWSRELALLSLCLLLVASCSRQNEHRAEFLIFGTIMDVTIWGATESQAEAAFSELQILFQAMHRDWHAWEPGALVEINRAFASGHPVPASDDILELISRSQGIEKKSGGRFNPAIGTLINLWGFHTSVFPILGPPPEAGGNPGHSGAVSIEPGHHNQRPRTGDNQPLRTVGFRWYCQGLRHRHCLCALTRNGYQKCDRECWW